MRRLLVLLLLWPWLASAQPAETLAQRLVAGGYAQIHFDLPGSASLVTVPASALVLRGQGTHVATVGHDGHVHLLNVVPGRDLGGSVEIASGLTRGTRIIDNPPDSISEDEVVRVEAANE